MNATLWLALGIVSSSFMGSWHCTAMCSPIASLMSHRKQLPHYHLGRLISYVSLGAIGGWLGQFFLNSSFVSLRYFSAALFSLLLLGMGLKLLFPRHFSQNLIPIHGWIAKLQHIEIFKSGFAVGLLTALLPCGWLYTYVTAAIATKNPVTGAGVLFLFWLGNLPALSLIPSMVKKSILVSSAKQRTIAGCILILASIYSVVSFFLCA